MEYTEKEFQEMLRKFMEENHKVRLILRNGKKPFNKLDSYQKELILNALGLKQKVVVTYETI